MPTVTLRPVLDGYKLNWTVVPEGTTDYYLLLDEVVADDATTEIYMTSGTGSNTAVYEFQFGAANVDTSMVLEYTKATLHMRRYMSPASDTYQGSASYGLSLGNVPSTDTTPTYSYADSKLGVTKAWTTLKIDCANILSALNSAKNLPMWGRVYFTGQGDNSKLSTVIYLTQVYLTLEYTETPSISIPLNLRVNDTTTTSISLAWGESNNAVSYNVYKDEVLQANTSNLSYTITLDALDNGYHTYSVAGVSVYQRTSSPASIKAQKEVVYEYNTISLTYISISPNPATINKTLTVSANADEVAGYTTAEKVYCAELYSGE